MSGSALLVSALSLGGVCTAFGVFIAIANRKFKVWEDPRIQQTEDLLPGTNCGACGTPGCNAFATGLVEGEQQPSGCTVMGPDEIDDVAAFLGVDAGEAQKRVARLMCAGGSDVAVQISTYEGHRSCQAAAAVTGGGKGCSWGCIGLGDCAVACDFDAIHMGPTGLPVVAPDKCTACNDCVEVCPKDLFELVPLEHELIVQCKSLMEGNPAKDLCSVACTGCGICAKDAADGVIDMVDGLAVVNYDQHSLATADAVKRCPTDAIVWVEGAQFPEQQIAPRSFAV